MKLEINGTTYQVPREYEQKIFDQLWNKEAVPWYEKLADAWKVGGMVLSRLVLAWMEQKIFDQLWHKEAVPWYEKLADAWKVAGMVLSRLVLAWMENKIYQETGDKEKSRSIRPPKKGLDPNLWAGEKLALILFEGMNYVTIACETGVDTQTGAATIVAFNLQIDAARAEAGLAVAENSSKTG